MPPPAEPEKRTRPDLVGCIRFPYDTLKEVTCGFNKANFSAGGNLLGEGGFGPVYLGYLCSTSVAIKVLQNASVSYISYCIDNALLSLSGRLVGMCSKETNSSRLRLAC